MESIFGSNIASLSNVPQIRYLQCPAGVKVMHLKRFITSKYDLVNMKVPMNIDIIYEDDVLSNDLSLMDIAYCYDWKRVSQIFIYLLRMIYLWFYCPSLSVKEAPMKFFYRIYKRRKHERQMNLIKTLAVNQPIVKYTSLTDNYHNKKIKNKSHPKMELQNVEPRHELKIIISKKPKENYDKNMMKNVGDKVLSQIPNKVPIKDFKQLRSNDEKTIFSTSPSSSSSSSSSSVSSNETKALLNKITITKQLKTHKNSSDTKKKPDKSKNKLKKYLIEENVDQQKIVIKKLKRENSIPSNYCYINKPLSKSNNLDVVKIKQEMPSLKTKISVPKQPNESYCITPKSTTTSPSLSKKVRFNFPINDDIMDTTTSTPTITNDVQLMQNEYAQKIGLKPVEKKVDSILLHRKRKKSKHSKNSIDIKRQKHHADVSSTDDKSLKMKITKNIKLNESSSNGNGLKHDAEQVVPKEYVINKNTCVVEKQLPIENAVPVVVVNNTKPTEKEQQKFLLSQKINSNALQPMVFIPKLNLKSTTVEIVNVPNPIVKEDPQLKSTEVAVKTIVECKDAKQTDVVMSSGSSDAVFVKPSRAKMGSPNNNIKKTHPKPFVPHQTYFTPRYGNGTTRPNSIPSTLKLSPISSYSQMDYQKKPGVNLEGFNNSQNRFLNNDLFSPGYDTLPNKNNNHPLRHSTLKMPPLVPASCIISDSSHISTHYNNNNNNLKVNELYKNIRPSNPIPTLSYTTMTSTPNSPQNVTFKKPQAVDILRVPSTQHNNRIKYSPMAAMDKRAIKYENFKINRPQLSTIPLDKIKQSHEISTNQTTISNKSNYYDNMPKLVSYQTSNVTKEKAIQSNNLLRDNTDILDFSTKYDQFTMKKNFHNDEITKMIEDQSGLNKDIISYEMELSKDIAKLDQRLSVEKNIEQHSKTHEKNLSVRNIPNPSALLFRNTSNFKQNDGNKEKIDVEMKVCNKSPTIVPIIQETSNVVDDFLNLKKLPSNSNVAREIGISAEQRLENALKMRSVAKQTLEKLVEHLHVNSKKIPTPIIPSSSEENDKNNNEDKSNYNDKDNNNNSNNNDKKVSNNCKLNDIICIDV